MTFPEIPRGPLSLLRTGKFSDLPAILLKRVYISGEQQSSGFGTFAIRVSYKFDRISCKGFILKNSVG